MSFEDQLYKYVSDYKSLPDWIKRFITMPLQLIPRKYLLGRSYSKFYNEAKEFEYKSAKEIEEYQFIKVVELLHYAYTNVEFYKNKWSQFGVNLKQIQDFNDFQKIIPFLTREDVQANPEKLLSKLYNKEDYLKMNSGGSTGIPLILYYLKGYSRAAEWAHMHVQWERVGYKVGSRMANLRGEFFNKDRYFSFDPYRNLLMLSSFRLTKETADDYLFLLDKYKVEFINAYPSSLFNLIQLTSHKVFELKHLKGILLGSENIFEWQIKIIKDFFVTNNLFYWYGHGELCALGGNCEKSNNYHFFPTYSYVELCRNTNFKNDDLIEIVGTSFINPLMPLIRYRTQDYVETNNSICDCGRNHKLAKKILGREQEMAIGFNGEKITLTALIFGRHADYFNHIKKMQIVNYNHGKLIIKIIPKSTFDDSHKKEIVDTLTVRQGMPFESEVEIVDDIESTARGKHRLLIRTFN